MEKNEVGTFQKVLKIKAVFRKLTQVSWNLNQLEKRYPIEGLSSEEIKELLRAYYDYIKETQRVSNELNEFNEGGNYGQIA